MDTYSSHSDDMSELECRLSAWQPASVGLDADAMLFAAGRASVRPSRLSFVWPALSVCLAGLAMVLGVCLNIERNEHRAFVQQVRRQSLASAPAPLPPIAVAPAEPLLPEEIPSNSVLASRRLLERGLDDWPKPAVAARNETPGAALPLPSVLHVGRRDLLRDP